MRRHPEACSELAKDLEKDLFHCIFPSHARQVLPQHLSGILLPLQAQTAGLVWEREGTEKLIPLESIIDYLHIVLIESRTYINASLQNN